MSLTATSSTQSTLTAAACGRRNLVII
uniref:Uncharacterized protein n=1 Tax=Anguilla anguilla TaxID=7936 RepID=A0A0E9VPR3_ANGAN